MNDSMHIAAASMAAHQASLEAIASNLSNVNTPGFKATRLSFNEMLQRSSTATGSASANSLLSAGVTVTGTTRDFASGGDLKKTGAVMDLGILGRGFLEVVLPDGTRAYSRGGTLAVNKNALLSTAAGQPLAPEISVPFDGADIAIQSDGRVLLTMPGQSNPIEAGRLELVRFVNPGALESMGNGLYRATEASGEPMSGRVGEEGMGTLVQGALEQSNVQMNTEMVALMQAQRAYELSARVLQVSDTLAAATNDLLRR